MRNWQSVRYTRHSGWIKNKKYDFKEGMMQLNPIAQELNAIIKAGNPYVMEMLSKTGRRLFFPKGILTQTAEARTKAYDKFNATIGMAMDNLRTMCLPTVMSYLNKDKLRPSEALTYAPSLGIPQLRDEWKAEMKEKNPSLKDKIIGTPVVTNGITHGISVFSDMFLDPDDVVIFPDKMWGNNHMIMSVRRDAEIINYQMFDEKGGFNVKAFETAIRKAAENNYKVVTSLNFPNNPTGYTISEKEADQIVGILKKVTEEGTNVIAIMDDAYFGLRYTDESIKESLFTKLCDIHPRLLAVKLDGATKEMFVWGLRVGFITYGTVIQGKPEPFYEALEKKTAGNIRGTVSNASRLGQAIVLKTLKSPSYRKEREEKVQILKKRALRVKQILTDPKFSEICEPYPFNSGYFMCLKLKKADAETARIYILEKYKAGLISIGNTDLRVAYSCVDEENLQELFDIIYTGIKELEAGATL